jgi:3-phosphoshikimate 1-carboxyvinyltransferase
MTLASRSRLRGRLSPPGDKSVAHRAALLASLADGLSEVEGFPSGDDCRRTLDLIRALGVAVDEGPERVSVRGRGLFAYTAPARELDAGNSGSTLRMGCGVLAGQPFDARLTGDESLRGRPMARVIEPLAAMGAEIEASPGGRAPLRVKGGRKLTGAEHSLGVPSAQVKTAVLLAALHAEGRTRVREPAPTRNHTELMLERFGVPVVRSEGACIEVAGGSRLQPARIPIPGDPSSAAFFIVGAAMLPGSDLVVGRLGLNPTRTGFLDVLEAMGADLTIDERTDLGGEPAGTLRVRGGRLRGVAVPAEWAPRLIDEIPILAVAAAFAEGETVFRGVAELRVKESDRLEGITDGLRALGMQVERWEDGFSVRGGPAARGAALDSRGDHRMAMAWAIASLGLDPPCELLGAGAVGVSYPGFWQELSRLSR